jgi:hypothetical protein
MAREQVQAGARVGQLDLWSLPTADEAPHASSPQMRSPPIPVPDQSTSVLDNLPKYGHAII